MLDVNHNTIEMFFYELHSAAIGAPSSNFKNAGASFRSSSILDAASDLSQAALSDIWGSSTGMGKGIAPQEAKLTLRSSFLTWTTFGSEASVPHAKSDSNLLQRWETFDTISKCEKLTRTVGLTFYGITVAYSGEPKIENQAFKVFLPSP